MAVDVMLWRCAGMALRQLLGLGAACLRSRCPGAATAGR